MYYDPLIRTRLEYEIDSLFGVDLAFELQGNQVTCYAVDKSFGQKWPLSAHGHGLGYYVSLFFYLYHPEIRVLFVDEPENSLHPQLQRELIARVRRIAREEDKQVFLATHSPLLALPETVDDLKGVFILQRYHSSPRIYPLDKVVPTDPDERKRFNSFLPNLDPAIAELFFASGGLIVEGQTERQFIQYVAAQTGRDPLRHGVTIVEANGLGLMPGLIRIARQVLEHWRAVCDGDLLTDSRDRFAGYREDLGQVLGMPMARATTDADSAEAREALWEKRVSVTSQKGLEHYYRSPEAIKQLADLKGQ
jgi:hypothetical protein